MPIKKTKRPLKCGNLTRYLLATVFPSWRLFGAVQVLPELLVRSKVQGDPDVPWSPWVRVIPKVPRVGWNMIFNPTGNIRLACHTLVQKWRDDALSETQIQSSVSFDLVKRLVEVEYVQRHLVQAYQFKIALAEGPVDGKGHNDPWQDLVISPVFGINKSC